MDAAEIDLSKTFEVGQGYVALSRIRSIKGLRLLGINDTALRVDPLILQIEDRMKEASQRFSDEMESYREEELEKKFKDFILKAGGTVKKEEIEEERAFLKEEREKLERALKSGDVEIVKREKKPNYKITEELIDRVADFQELVEKRGMTAGTVIGHLQKIKEMDPAINLEKFKPNWEVVDMVREAVEDLKKENKKENFLEDGTLKLKPIFNALDGEVSYDDIKLALLFMD